MATIAAEMWKKASIADDKELSFLVNHTWAMYPGKILTDKL